MLLLRDFYLDLTSQFRMKFLKDCYYFRISIAGVSNSNRSEGQMKTCKVTRGPHYNTDETIAVRRGTCTVLLTRNSFTCHFLRKVWWVKAKSFLVASTFVYKKRVHSLAKYFQTLVN